MTEYENHRTAQSEIGDYIHYYLTERKHSSLGFHLAPKQFEQLLSPERKRSPVRQIVSTSGSLDHRPEKSELRSRPPLFTVFLILACLHYVWIFRTFSWHFWQPLHGNCVRRN